jgi:hypothetical protein
VGFRRSPVGQGRRPVVQLGRERYGGNRAIGKMLADLTRRYRLLRWHALANGKSFRGFPNPTIRV